MCRGNGYTKCLRNKICKNNPYLKIVKIQGDIKDFYPASVMEMFFSSIKNHQCTLEREYQEE